MINRIRIVHWLIRSPLFIKIKLITIYSKYIRNTRNIKKIEKSIISILSILPRLRLQFPKKQFQEQASPFIKINNNFSARMIFNSQLYDTSSPQNVPTKRFRILPRISDQSRLGRKIKKADLKFEPRAVTHPGPTIRGTINHINCTWPAGLSRGIAGSLSLSCLIINCN